VCYVRVNWGRVGVMGGGGVAGAGIITRNLWVDNCGGKGGGGEYCLWKSNQGMGWPGQDQTKTANQGRVSQPVAAKP